MKKVLLFLGFILASNAMATEVIFYNRSTLYDVSVYYQFCGRSGSSILCTESTLIVVPKLDSNHKNYVSIPVSPDYTLINVNSAEEKGAAGKRISYGRYSSTETDMKGLAGFCISSISVDMDGYLSNVIFVLDDLNGSPIVMCDAHEY